MKPKPNPDRLKLKNVALFDASDEPLQATSQKTIAISKIVLPPQQPRRYFDPHKMATLVESVRQHGILEPILLRSLDQNTYELVAGERRYQAAKEVGLEEIPAIVRSMTQEEAWQIALIENLQREELNPLEETEAVLQLLVLRLKLPLDEVISKLYRQRHIARGEVGQNVLTNSENLGETGQNVLTSSENNDEISSVFSSVFHSLGFKLESFITSRLPLLKLPPEILEALRQGRIAYTKALAIAKVKEPIARQQLLDYAIAYDLSLAQIAARLATLTQLTVSKQGERDLKTQVDITFRSLKKSQIWQDPKKQKRLEKLIQQIEALIADS